MTLVNGFVTCDDLRAQGVSDQVAAIVDVLPGVAYTRTSPAYLDTRACGEEIRRQADTNFASVSTRPVAIKAFELPMASVFGQGTVLLRDGFMVRDSAQEFLAHDLAPDGSIKTIDGLATTRDPESECLSGRSLLVKRPWYRNFGHWLVDLMPLPSLIENVGLQIDRVIIGEVTQPQLLEIIMACLKDAFPTAEILSLSDERHVRCQTLIYVAPVHIPPMFKHPLALERTVACARRIFTNGSPISTGRRIYLSRQKAAARRLTNSEDLEILLSKYNFEPVFAEAMTFDDQISLFSGAEMIVGVKGAALTNAIFSPVGAKMLVISPSQFIDPFFWDLVAPRGIQYSEIFCSADPHAPPSMLDFAVDLSSVEQYFRDSV